MEYLRYFRNVIICYYVIHCSDVVRLERPDLEKQRNELITNIDVAKNELKV